MTTVIRTITVKAISAGNYSIPFTITVSRRGPIFKHCRDTSSHETVIITTFPPYLTVPQYLSSFYPFSTCPFFPFPPFFRSPDFQFKSTLPIRVSPIQLGTWEKTGPVYFNLNTLCQSEYPLYSWELGRRPIIPVGAVNTRNHSPRCLACITLISPSGPLHPNNIINQKGTPQIVQYPVTIK
ncbi:hypothetical protein FPQ18DRAFT_301555 [Pyronema domesticum]|nr:hypothetical protein FPQ18DRAFT_301555 [Pyronema domesticum]